MEKLHRNLLSLVKLALTGESASIDSDIDYKQLISLSTKHQIFPLVFDGLYKAKGSFQGIDQCRKHVFHIVGRDQNQLYFLKKIESLFNDNSIDYMLLKGSSIKKYYPASEFRLMGDIDILIKESQYKTIKPLFLQMGFNETAESDHELIWRHNSGVIVELHKRLIPSYNDDYYAYYINPWEKAIYKSNHSYSMSKEDEYIYIFTHLTKHYRDGGIGLRHLIDVWFFALKHSLLNKSYINKELDKLGLLEFHNNIIDTLDVWFNGKEATELTDYITKRIIESGAFGLEEWHNIANAARATARNDSVSSAKTKTIFKLIFLPLDDMKKKFSILERLPCLLPLMWVIRWINAIFNKKSSIVTETNRLSYMDDQIVDNYNKELQMVGLKFELKKK
jgi:hypothetical protein